MKILGLDSSGLVASIAMIEDDNLVAEYTINYKKTHSQTLLPMLETIKEMLELDLHTLDGIAVASGPGSFTGLRIGSATAKGLAQALNIPIIEVPTLEGLAYQGEGRSELICPIMDARRGQVYTGRYQFDNGNLICKKEQCAISLDDLLQELEGTNDTVLFLGDGVDTYKEEIKQKAKFSYCFGAPHRTKQSAACVAVVGKAYYQQGKVVIAKEHSPIYLRKSQAERERLEKEKDA